MIVSVVCFVAWLTGLIRFAWLTGSFVGQLSNVFWVDRVH